MNHNPVFYRGHMPERASVNLIEPGEVAQKLGSSGMWLYVMPMRRRSSSWEWHLMAGVVHPAFLWAMMMTETTQWSSLYLDKGAHHAGSNSIPKPSCNTARSILFLCVIFYMGQSKLISRVCSSPPFRPMFQFGILHRLIRRGLMHLHQKWDILQQTLREAWRMEAPFHVVVTKLISLQRDFILGVVVHWEGSHICLYCIWWLVIIFCSPWREVFRESSSVLDLVYGVHTIHQTASI